MEKEIKLRGDEYLKEFTRDLTEALLACKKTAEAIGILSVALFKMNSEVSEAIMRRG